MMNWGYKIAIVFIGFVVLMVSMVTICFRQKDIHLVEKQYYEKEIAYQSQINIERNTATLENPPVIRYHQENQTVKVEYSPMQAIKEGSILFFRPSDASKDFTIAVNANKGSQSIPVGHLQKGLWKVKMEWTDASRKFYLEEKVVVL